MKTTLGFLLNFVNCQFKPKKNQSREYLHRIPVYLQRVRAALRYQNGEDDFDTCTKDSVCYTERKRRLYQNTR